MTYKCYIIFNDNYSYVGITNNLNRRIRQHNQLISGGAKYTSLINSFIVTKWSYACYVDGFKNKIDALRFEWALKHVKPKNKTGIINRIKKLIILLNKPNWTTKSPTSINYKLTIYWCELFLIPEIINVPKYIQNDYYIQ
jgi:predicted GIY-YIG superfamily endonuclease